VNRTVFTIGYEGATPATFVDALLAARVEVLVDVRAAARSRRRGFAKTALRAALEGAGIAYLHVPALGNPKEGREAAWAGDLARFRAVFRAHLRGSAAQDALRGVAATSRSRRACLMCMEADPDVCHRKIVADALARIEAFSVHHIRVGDSDAGVGG
jgi:uncharacterized protein (DUF488 family)